MDEMEITCKETQNVEHLLGNFWQTECLGGAVWMTAWMAGMRTFFQFLAVKMRWPSMQRIAALEAGIPRRKSGTLLFFLFLCVCLLFMFVLRLV